MSEAGSTGPRRLDISYPTTEFSKLVKMWEKYDEATMGIVVRHIKRYCLVCVCSNKKAYKIVASVNLPDYVFDGDERQPRSAQKRPKTKVC